MKQKVNKLNSPVCFYTTKKMSINKFELKDYHLNQYYFDSKFYPTKFYKKIINL
jgi:hypothetical protein